MSILSGLKMKSRIRIRTVYKWSGTVARLAPIRYGWGAKVPVVVETVEAAASWLHYLLLSTFMTFSKDFRPYLSNLNWTNRFLVNLSLYGKFLLYHNGRYITMMDHFSINIRKINFIVSCFLMVGLTVCSHFCAPFLFTCVNIWSLAQSFTQSLASPFHFSWSPFLDLAHIVASSRARLL